MSSPAESTAPSPLLGIPLEIRHHVFSHVAAARDIPPHNTLRYWFEKADIQEQIAEKLNNDPDANVTYVAGYNDRYDHQDEPLVGDDAAVEDDENNEDDEPGEDNENEEDNEDEDEQDGEDNGDDVDEAEDTMGDDDEVMSDDVTDGTVAVPNNAQGGATTTTPIGPDQSATENNQALEDTNASIAAPTVAMDAQGGSDNAAADPQTEQGDQNADITNAAGGDINAEDDTTAEDDITAGDDIMAGDDITVVDNVAAEGEADYAAASSKTPVIVVKPHQKWRHVSKFMRLTQCPPQANLFLISKQLNMEAKTWFYDVATLNIDATASFSHFTFFELALNKLAAAPFSPMEHIKNAEITFVWDTTWIRNESTGFAGAVFPVFLKSRVDFILEILLRAPELQNLKIIWHDSAQDDGAMQLRVDTLEPFIMNLKAVVETEDHYVAPDAKPRARSRAGKQRLEFQALFDNGCETF